MRTVLYRVPSMLIPICFSKTPNIVLNFDFDALIFSEKLSAKQLSLGNGGSHLKN